MRSDISVALSWEMALLYVSQNIYLVSKSLHQLNMLETVLFLFTVTICTLFINYTLSENPSMLRQKTFTWKKKAAFEESYFSPFFRFFWSKLSLENRNTVFPQNKRCASNKRCPLKSAASLPIRLKKHRPVISATPQNLALIRNLNII